MKIRTTLVTIAKGVGSLLLGGLILWQVAARQVGAGPCEAIVHVSEKDVVVTIDDMTFRVGSQRYVAGEPITCDLNSGRHEIRMERSGRLLYEQEFVLEPGEQIILSAWDTTRPGPAPSSIDLVASGGDAHHTDAVEVYVDGTPDARRGQIKKTWDLAADTMPVLQYAAVPSSGRAYGDPWSRNPSLVFGQSRDSGTVMKYQRKEKDRITLYEWAIQAYDKYPDQPTQLVPGKRLGFDLAVVDRDRDRPLSAWLSWGPSPTFFKGVEPGNLGELRLGDGSNPSPEPSPGVASAQRIQAEDRLVPWGVAP